MKNPEVPTFSSVINMFLGSPKFMALAKNSQAGYRRYLLLAEHPNSLGAIPADEIKPKMILAFLDTFLEGDPRPGAQQNAYVALKALEWWAAGPRELTPAFMKGIEIEGTDGGHKPWTDAQVALAEQHARPDIARAIVLAANTGQRASDLVCMAWCDIVKHEGRPGINVIQKKTGLELWIPFTQHLISAMATWERKEAPVSLRGTWVDTTPILLKRDGSPWTRSDISMAWTWERRHNEALAPCRDQVLHGLRATACIRLRRLGATESQISAMVGLSIPMVARYCRKSAQVDNAVAAADFLDGTNRERTIVKFVKQNSAE